MYITFRDNDHFNEEVFKNVPIVVKCGASWCRPCQRVDPFFEEWASEETKMRFAKLGIDTSPELAAVATQCGVKTIPAFLVFQAGKLLCVVASSNIDDVKSKVNETIRESRSLITKKKLT